MVPAQKRRRIWQTTDQLQFLIFFRRTIDDLSTDLVTYLKQ